MCLWIDQVFIKLNYWLQWLCRELDLVEGSTYLLFENKVNFSLALWNFNSWNYLFYSNIVIVVVLQYLLFTKCEVNWYIWLFMHIVYKQVILMMCECLQACTPQPAPYCQGCRTPSFREDNLSQVRNWPPEWSVYNHLYYVSYM